MIFLKPLPFPPPHYLETLPMSGLRDQLLKAGLVNQKQIKKAEKEKIKQVKATSHKPAAKPVSPEADAQAEKAARDRLLNQQRLAEIEKRGLAAQVRQLIETRKLPRTEGEMAFHFTDNGTVKTLHLPQAQRDQLIQGQIALVKLDRQYELVPRETGEKIEERDKRFILVLNPKEKEDGDSRDDPYADYEVPDDLIW